MPALASVVIDTTARVHIRTKDGQAPDVAAINEALASTRTSVKEFAKKELVVAAEILEVKIKGMA